MSLAAVDILLNMILGGMPVEGKDYRLVLRLEDRDFRMDREDTGKAFPEALWCQAENGAAYVQNVDTALFGVGVHVNMTLWTLLKLLRA